MMTMQISSHGSYDVSTFIEMGVCKHILSADGMKILTSPCRPQRVPLHRPPLPVARPAPSHPEMAGDLCPGRMSRGHHAGNAARMGGWWPH